MTLRSLSDISAAGDDAWFERALSLLRAVPYDSDVRVRDFFEPGQPVFIARAPGRLDVMGGIADYSGSLVLQLPLACSTSVLLQRTAARTIEVLTRRPSGWHHFEIGLGPIVADELSEPAALAAWFAEREHQRWAAYVVGCIQTCVARARAHGRVNGFRVLIDSDVPEGKGVSSSAALEVATMTAVAASCDVERPCEELALACQWVENHIVGAPCGVMDQMTSACGMRGRLLRLLCQPAVIEGYIDVPAGFRFYGIDSGVRHAVKGAAYTTVRTAAFMGHRIISELTGARYPYLAAITPAEFRARFERQLPERMSGREFLSRYDGIADTATHVDADREYPVRQATAHPVHEHARVVAFARLLENLDAKADAAAELGSLMYASHASYSACGLGSSGTDRIVELVREHGSERGLFGAKITGGGSGGTVAIFATAVAEPRVREIAARYAAETGRGGIVFAASGPSAGETGVLLVNAPTASQPAIS